MVYAMCLEPLNREKPKQNHQTTMKHAGRFQVFFGDFPGMLMEFPPSSRQLLTLWNMLDLGASLHKLVSEAAAQKTAVQVESAVSSSATY